MKVICLFNVSAAENSKLEVWCLDTIMDFSCDGMRVDSFVSSCRSDIDHNKSVKGQLIDYAQSVQSQLKLVLLIMKQI